jgi:hypothetical protein
MTVLLLGLGGCGNGGASSGAGQPVSGVTFTAHLATNLPEGEVVCVKIKELDLPTAMERKPDGSWQVTLNTLTPGSRYSYKYCRNWMDQGADEAFDSGNATGWRVLTAGPAQMVDDTIRKWRWWPVDGVVLGIDTSQHETTVPAELPRSEFQSGVMLPDYWWRNFGNDVSPTLGTIRERTAASWIQYAPVPAINQFYPSPLIVREGINGTPETQLLSILQAARSTGLKVFLNPFGWPKPGLSDTSPSAHSAEWWQAYEQQWRPIQLYYADIAARSGAEMLGVAMWPNLWSLSASEISVVDPLARALLADVRRVYKGAICVPYNPFGDQTWNPPLTVYADADYLCAVAWDSWPFRLSESRTPGVSEMRQAFGNGVDQYLLRGSRRWAKPVVLMQIAASSFDGSVIGDPNWEDQLYYYEDNPAVRLDLQEQADAYEAMLSVALRRGWIAGVYSFNYNYWDSMDKAPSIRAKPAERVVAKWYRWTRGL